jgi:thiamine pyrophosphokinase
MSMTEEKRTCGLLPIGVRGTTISTTGLAWNLDQDWCAFGGLVSTSNHVTQEIVWVRTSEHLVWTCRHLLETH